MRLLNVLCGAAVAMATLPPLTASGQTPPIRAISPTGTNARSAAQMTLRPDQQAFRALYRELVETNTELSDGSCTLAAEKMAARLRSAGYGAPDLHPFTAPGHPKEGGLVAVLHGTDPKAKAILLLAHIDVVEARRADWTRDPFTLVEENGYFYGRGSSDDKAEASVWVDTLARLKQEGFRPRRDVKMALTCGEETSGAFNGASWLATHERSLIDAQFALNEGAGGRLDASGRPVALNVEAGEKFPQDYVLEVTNPGGHSSRPSPDNAIYRLAYALLHVASNEFPIAFTDASKVYFTKTGPLIGGQMGAAMIALANDPTDANDARLVETDPGYNGMLHTTCVATMLEAGHATNALPQRARANINCRIFPGASAEQVRDALIKAIGDPKVSVTMREARSEPVTSPPPLTAQIMEPIVSSAAKVWPGVPVIPVLTAGATDGAFLTPVGVPTYGVTGMFGDPDGNGVHGLNERIRVKSLMDGRDFLYDLVKTYAMQG
ncbi:MAG TPA: M20/M25/M40 family metallo-hydrolase [Caulobacteraceae bacterium]|jgi:acetylornithine deacetylase/succinyl-diaminopimelate desuccinylase-like protein|nr:M20/M25/M40 family metallo-hydrolase [Caulobacteraceae bacterium]